MHNQNIVIVGLGPVGTSFMEELSALAPKGVNIIAAVPQGDASGSGRAQQLGIALMDLTDMLALGAKVDIIFDLSGSTQVRADLRKQLFAAGNQHTVIAPENIAWLLYNVLSASGTAPAGDQGYGS